MFGAHPMLRTGGAVSYSVPYSLRFRAANSAYMNRTPASAGNRKTATISMWIKRGNISSAMDPLGVAAGNTEAIRFNATNTMMIRFGNLDSTTNALFRDPSAWGHLVIARDTTQATSTDRLKAWWNGSALTFSSYSVPAQNADTDLFNTVVHNLGASTGPGNIYDGYMAEVNFIDGQALTPSSFGQTDATTGVWVPKKYSGTYGANGFYLKFADATTTTTIGYDSSGNANNWTTSGISVTSGVTFDQMTDTPTLNYCVLSQVDRYSSTMNPSDASLAIVNSSAGSYQGIRSTVAMTTGKWYCEGTITASGSLPNSRTGAALYTAADVQSTYGGVSATSWAYFSAGLALNNNVSTTLTSGSLALNDVFQIAFDADAGKLWFGKNGTWLNSGDPATGANPIYSGIAAGTYFIGGWAYNTADKTVLNFGQRAFAYTPPTGFKALNTANLPTPSIKKGSIYFDATLRTGTGATASVSSLGFQPDLVWIKSRSAATDHGLYDAVRGVQKQLESNTTTAETTETTGLTAFNSNGYTVGALAQLNTNAATYVDWAWKEGATPGFDIVTYVGNGTNRTISHNLGAVPKLIILRSREATSTGRWTVQHGYYGSARYAYLNETFAFDTANANLRWNSTDPTSSVFSIGTSSDVNHTNDNYVGYLWSEIEGFSKISSYIGNGSTDGPFVFCGFRPRYVLIKSTGAENWSVQDSARNPFNVVDARLKPNSADAEAVSSVQNVDFLSNGFKIRTTDPEKNGSGTTYIFAAYAENPFKYARAR